MSAAKNKTIDNETYLQSHEDWEKWFSRLTVLATRKGIWKYFNPDDEDGPVLEEPIQLTYDEYLQELNDNTQRDYQERLEEWQDAEQPGRRPTRPARLTILGANELKVLAERREDYKVAMTKYRMDYEKIESINTWIDKTVDASWRELAKEATNPREVVQALQRNVAQSQGEIVQRASNNYISTLNSLNKSVDPLEWYKKWDIARMDGEKHSIPELQGQLAISRFLQVIRKASSALRKCP